MGKRQLGELAPSELVVTVLISDLASMPLQDIGIPLVYGIVPVLTLICAEVLISYGTLKSIGFRLLIGGRPSVIISEGKINQSEMKKNRLTIDELTVEMRKQNVLDIGKIRYGILEADGTLSLMLYSAENPVTPNQLSLSVTEEEYPLVVVCDGRLLSDNLKKLGFDERWLMKILRKNKVHSLSEVYILFADRNGRINLTKKE